MASRLPSFIRLPSHYRFDYKPRYYDPVKEKAEEKEKRIKLESGGQVQYGSRLIGQFKRQRYIYGRKKAVRENMGIRIFLLAAMMTVLGGYFLGYTSGVITFVILLILFVIFIKKNQTL